MSVNLEPSQFLAGWREKSGTLFLPVLSESRVGEEVAARVGIYGHAIRATLFGRITLVRRIGRPALPPGVEVLIEEHSRAAARFLASASRGEPVSFKERAPRWAIETTLRFVHRGGVLEASTINVSIGGCAVRWPVEPPEVGDEIDLRIRRRFFTTRLRTIVCWTKREGEGTGSVGLKVLTQGRRASAWHALVHEAAGSGGRPS